MKSMTGYGAARLESRLFNASIAMKSWNNRFLELNLQLPAFLAPVEPRVREFLESRVARGKVELTVRARGGDLPTEVTVDTAAAKAVAEALRELSRAAGIDEPVRLSHLLGIEGILGFERDANADELWAALEPALDACVKAFDAQREREGAATAADLEEKLRAIGESVASVEALAPGLETAIRQDLRRRFTEAMGDLVDEARVVAEIAAYLAKHTINEEIVRLKAHIASFRAAMLEPVCGKKLDFICQELNRETNTIGSKSVQVELSSIVIRMKDAVENIREQVRNVE